MRRRDPALVFGRSSDAGAMAPISLIPSAPSPFRATRTGLIERQNVAVLAADRHSWAVLKDGRTGVEQPDLGEVAVDGGDVAAIGVDGRRGLPERVVVGRAADRRADRQGRRLVFP